MINFQMQEEIYNIKVI